MAELQDNITDESENLVQALLWKPKHMNHKKWKAYLKKMKRKQKRKAAAKERDLIGKHDVTEALKTDSEEEKEREKEEWERQKQNQLWLERERQAEAAFKAKKEWEEYERKRKEEIERKIKEEWEQRERKEKEEREAKEKEDQEKRDKQDKLLKEATANENTNAWHNPIAPVQYGTERQVDYCPFFKKMAACRFGDHCSRYHHYPEISNTILIPNMFTSFQLEQSIVDNYDTDVSLEYDDNELYQSFREFYEDVVPEFKTVGTIVQLKVCCNCEPHLRGNVYVQYKRESAAQKAYEKFNARWYGGRQLTCIFVVVESWKSAICGLAFKRRCPKGKSCNFLHVFRNPRGEFTELDYDQIFTDRNDHQNDKDRSSTHSKDSVQSSHSRRHSASSRMSSRPRSRSASKSRSERSRTSRKPPHHHSRSRSRDRTHRYKRSRSRKRRSRRYSNSPPESHYKKDSPKSDHYKSGTLSKRSVENENNSGSYSEKNNSHKKRKSSSSSYSESSSDSEEEELNNRNNHKISKIRKSSDPETSDDTEYEYVEKTKESLVQ
ncbi:putative U2 small nuclear ribonucleoprotein auxiliary factor 35 kDa subunit- protein 1 [Bulinus truncatus]|nr:putative U2 small nuclear ribonucleoprotein auxiliary factor 35 kDa subunit- protein 1 [Bulinus truncatus]